MRTAYSKGYGVIAITDCCATTSREAHHAALRNFGYFSTPMCASEFEKMLARDSSLGSMQKRQMLQAIQNAAMPPHLPNEPDLAEVSLQRGAECFGEPVILESWGMKQSKWLRRWRERWLVLTPSALQSFASRQGYTFGERRGLKELGWLIDWTSPHTHHPYMHLTREPQRRLPPPFPTGRLSASLSRRCLR